MPALRRREITLEQLLDELMPPAEGDIPYEVSDIKGSELIGIIGGPFPSVLSEMILHARRRGRPPKSMAALLVRLAWPKRPGSRERSEMRKLVGRMRGTLRGWRVAGEKGGEATRRKFEPNVILVARALAKVLEEHRALPRRKWSTEVGKKLGRLGPRNRWRTLYEIEQRMKHRPETLPEATVKSLKAAMY